MGQLVSKSFVDASQAERAVRNLLEMGYSQADINIIINDRQRRRYMRDSPSRDEFEAGDAADVEGDRRGRGAIRALASRVAADTQGGPPSAAVVMESALVLGGPFAGQVPGGESGTVDPRKLVDVIVDAGVTRREAERMTQDVSRGGFLIAVSAHGDGVMKAKRAFASLDERGPSADLRAKSASR